MLMGLAKIDGSAALKSSAAGVHQAADAAQVTSLVSHADSRLRAHPCLPGDKTAPQAMILKMHAGTGLGHLLLPHFASIYLHIWGLQFSPDCRGTPQTFRLQGPVACRC